MGSGSRALKNKLRSWRRRIERVWVRAFFSYGPDELIATLRRMGVQPGDTLMVHSAFEFRHGFLGTTDELIEALLAAIGPQGNLLMVSLPYRSSTLEYLSKGKPFDVRRTPSAMGLVSEFFRRRPGVLRSLHPTHPMLACGPRAGWFITGHEHCEYPCGPGTPFEKALQASGKALFFNVGLPYLTFFHYLEHMVRDRSGVRLYTEMPIEASAIDAQGERRVVRTYVYTPEAIRSRRFPILEGWLRSRGLVRETRVGATRLILVELREIVNTVEEMAGRGEYFYVKDKGPIPMEKA